MMLNLVSLIGDVDPRSKAPPLLGHAVFCFETAAFVHRRARAVGSARVDTESAKALMSIDSHNSSRDTVFTMVTVVCLTIGLLVHPNSLTP